MMMVMPITIMMMTICNRFSDIYDMGMMALFEYLFNLLKRVPGAAGVCAPQVAFLQGAFEFGEKHFFEFGEKTLNLVSNIYLNLLRKKL